MASSSAQQQVEAIVAPALSQAGYELVQARYVDAMRTLRLTIDHLVPPSPPTQAAPASADAADSEASQGGVSLEDCVKASKVADAALESCAEHAQFSHENLEVSSPGIERPLIKPAHFQRFVGQPIRLVLRPGVVPNAERKLQGKLVGADDVSIELMQPVATGAEAVAMKIDYSQIDRANLVYEAFPPTPQKRGRGPKPRARSKE